MNSNPNTSLFRNADADRLVAANIIQSCAWDDCRDPRIFDLPVCHFHALGIYGRIRASLTEAEIQVAKRSQREPFVYYLMLKPSLVKIGTTINLRQRMSGLRCDVERVVALERGGRDLERERHNQFAAERYQPREDFELSDRLKRHIKALQPQRDKFMAIATAR